MDLPNKFTIRERSHRIINPITSEQLATLGHALGLAPGTRILDLACGKGELLCTWARDHHTIGTGVDITPIFLAAARDRAVELGVADRVTFVAGDASGYVSEEPVDLAACIGATWIGDGLAGTMALLERSLRPGGMLLIGEPYWRREPVPAAVEACFGDIDVDTDYVLLPELVERFNALGWDVVEMINADEGSWDRYVAAGWLNMRRWLDDHPGDPLAAEIRSELTASQLNHTRYQRDYLGWGVFALLRR